MAGVGEVDRAQIAQQMAEALIAQGKTDVSSEELAQLVDAVVGMAEAKKREAEKTKKVVARPLSLPGKPAPTKLCGTATALQMLQSAYDENDKRQVNCSINFICNIRQLQLVPIHNVKMCKLFYIFGI